MDKSTTGIGGWSGFDIINCPISKALFVTVLVHVLSYLAKC